MTFAPAPHADGVRILRVFSRLNIGGPSRHVLLLTSGLRARGYETRLVVGQESRSEGNLMALAREMNVECWRLATLGREVRWILDLRSLWSIVSLIRKFRPDILHTHTAKAGALGRIAARLAGVPVVVHTYHGHVLDGYFGRLRTTLYRGIEQVLASRSDCLLAVSESVRADLLRLGVGTERQVRVMPLGLELEPFTRSLPRGRLRTVADLPMEAPLVGVVGRLVPIKDLPTFLEAARRISRELPQARFAIVGDGIERDALERLSGQLGLKQHVRFLGWMSDMRDVYGDLDLVVNSSRNEGTPVALIEALASGRPVVATRVGGTPDLLEDGRFGWLAPPADPDALAQAMLEALASPEEARSRAEAGRRHVLARYSAGRLIDDMDALYQELLAAKRSRGRSA